MADQENPDFKYIVRIANTDLDGKRQTAVALAVVKGVGVRLGAIVCERAGVPRYGRIGDLSDEQVQQLDDMVGKLPEIVPGWMLNRQRDRESGEDLHHHGSDLEIQRRDDINHLKKIQTFRGIRHGSGQKVRGQRSRSNGRTGMTMGVIKKKEGSGQGAK